MEIAPPLVRVGVENKGGGDFQRNTPDSFDAENGELSIGEVFRAIPALCCELGAKMCTQNF